MSAPYADRVTVELPYGDLLASIGERMFCRQQKETNHHRVAIQAAYLHTQTLADFATQARAVMVQTLMR